MAPGLFPFRDEGKILNVNSIWLLARCADPGPYSMVLSLIPSPQAPLPAGSDTFSLARVNQFGGLHFANKTKQDSPPLFNVTINPSAPPTKWQLNMTGPAPDPTLGKNEVEDVFLVLGYEWE